MATGTGLDAQIGFVAEVTWNTGVVVTRFLPLVSETLASDIERTESAAIIAGRQVMTTNEWAAGNKKVGGDTKFELYDQSISLLLKAAFGTVSSAAAGATAVHTFFPASPVVSLTAQVGRPTVYGTVIPHTYTGCKVSKWEIAGKAGEFLTFDATWMAAEESAGTALAVASYATNLKRWHMRSAAFTVDGTTVPVADFKVSGDNKLAERRFGGGTIISEPLREDLAEYMGEITVEWGGPTAMGTLLYDRFTQGTEGTFVASLAAGTLRGTITANARFDGVTPNVGGRGIIQQSVPFKCVSPTTSDADAITIKITSNDSAA